MTLNLKQGRILVFYFNFLQSAAHISGVNCAEIAKDKPEQSA